MRHSRSLLSKSKGCLGEKGGGGGGSGGAMLEEDASADQIWATLKARRAALLSAGSKTARAKALDAMVDFLGDVAAARGRLLHKWRAWGWVLLALYQVVEDEVQDFMQLPGIRRDAEGGTAVVGAKRKRAGKSAAGSAASPRTDFWVKLIDQLEVLHSESAPPTLHLDSNGRKLLDKLFGYASAVIGRVRSRDAAFERVAESIDALAWRTVRFIAKYRVYCSVLPHSTLQTVLEFALSALDDGDRDAESDGAAARNALAVRAHFVVLAIKNYPFDLQDGLPVLVECLTGWFHLIRPENVMNTVWRVPSSVKGETLSRVAPVVLDGLTALCKRYHSSVGSLLFKDRHLFDVLHFIQRTWKTYKFGSHGPQMEFILQFAELYHYNVGSGCKVHGVNRLDVCRELGMFARALLDFKDLIDLVTYRKPSTRGSSFGAWSTGATALDLTTHTDDTIVLYLTCAAEVVYLHDRLVTEMASRSGGIDQPDDVVSEHAQALQIALLWERIVENACRAPRVESMILRQGSQAFMSISGETASRDQGVGLKTPELSVEEVKRLAVAWMMVLLSLLCRYGAFYTATRIGDVMTILTEFGSCLVATEVQQVQYYALLTLIQVADVYSKNRDVCGDLLDEAWVMIWTNLVRTELPYVRVTGETSLWNESAGDAVLVLLNYFVASGLVPASVMEAHSSTLWNLPALQPASARIPATVLRRGGATQVTGASVPAVMLMTSLLNMLQLSEHTKPLTTANDDSCVDSEPSTTTVSDKLRSSAVPTRTELLSCVFDNLRSYVCHDDSTAMGPHSFDSEKDEYMPMVFASVIGAFRRYGAAKNRSGARAFLPAFLQRLTSPHLVKTEVPAAELSGFGIAFSHCDEGLNFLTTSGIALGKFKPDSFSPMIDDALATFSLAGNSTARAMRQSSTFERVRIPAALMRSVLPSVAAESAQPIVNCPIIHAISISDSTKALLHSEVTNQFQTTLRELSTKLAAAKSDPVQLTRLLVQLQRVGLILALVFTDLGEQCDDNSTTPPLQLIPLLKSFLELFTSYFSPDTVARARLKRSAAPLIAQILVKFHSFILALQSPDALATCSHPSSVQLNFRILPELRLPIRQVVAAVEECLALATEAARSGKDTGDMSGPTSVSFAQMPRASAVAIRAIEAKVDPMDVETNSSDKSELLLSDAVQMTINLWCFRVVFLLKKEAGAEVVKRHVGDLQFSPDFLLAVAIVAAGVPVADSLDVFVRLVNHGVSEAAGDSKKMQWHHSFSGAFYVSQVLTALSLAGRALEKRKAMHHDEMPASLSRCAHQFLELSFSHPLRLHVPSLRAAEIKCLEVFFRLNSDAFPDFESAPLEGVIDTSLFVRVESARALQTLLYMFPDGQSSICGEISNRLNGGKSSEARAKIRAQNKTADMCLTDSLCWYICAASFEDAVPDALFFYLRVAADERRAMPPSAVHAWTRGLADAYDYPSVHALVDDHFGFLWWSFMAGRRAMAKRAALKDQHDPEPLEMNALIETFPVDVLLGQQQQLDHRDRLQLFVEKMDEIFPLIVLSDSIDEPGELGKSRQCVLAQQFADMIGELRQTTSTVLFHSTTDDNIVSDLMAFSFTFRASGLKDLTNIADVQYGMANKRETTASLSVSSCAHIVSKLASLAVLGVTDPRWIAWSHHHSPDDGEDEDEENVFLEGEALWTQSMLQMKKAFPHFQLHENDVTKLLTRFYIVLLRSKQFGPRAERAVDCFQCFVREIQGQLTGNAVLQRLVLVICFQAIKQLTAWPRKRIARTLTFLVRELCELFMKTPDCFGKYFSLVVEEIGDILMSCGGSNVSGTPQRDSEVGAALYLDEDNQGHLEWVVFAICNDMGSLGKFASTMNAVPKGVSACLDKLNSLIDASRGSSTDADQDSMKVVDDPGSSSLGVPPLSAHSSEYIKRFIETETKNETKFYNPRRTLDSFGLPTLGLNSRGYQRATASSSQPSRPSHQRQAGAIVRLSKLSKSIQRLRQSGRPQDLNELTLTAGKLAHVLLYLGLTGVDNTASGRRDDVVVGIANVLGDIGALDSNEFDLSPGVDVDELSRLFKRRFQRCALSEMVPAPLPVMHLQLLACLCSIVFERKMADADVISEALSALRGILGTEAGQRVFAQCKDKELKQFLSDLSDSAGADWSSSLEDFLVSAPRGRSSRRATLFELWRQGDTLGFQSWICAVSASLAEESPDPLLRVCSNLVAIRADIAVFVFPFLLWTFLSPDKGTEKTPVNQQALERKSQTQVNINEGIRWILKQASGERDLDMSWQDADVLAPSAPPAEVVQTIIHSINFLRETEKAKFMLPRAKEAKGNASGSSRQRQHRPYTCMVDVDLLDVARAAVSVKMPFTAMQYVEMWIENTRGGMLPLSNHSLDDDASSDRIRRILVDAYKDESNIDGIYGVNDGRTFESQLITYSQENNYTSTLPLYDVILQFQDVHRLRVSGAGAHAAEGMLLSLQKLGYNHLLEGYMNAVLSLPTHQGKQAPSLLSDYKYERAWKNMQWNAVMTDNAAQDPSGGDRQSVYSHHRMLFQSLKAITHRDFGGLKEITSIAKTRILRSLHVSLGGFEATQESYRALANLQSIREIEEVAAAMGSERLGLSAGSTSDVPRTGFSMVSAMSSRDGSHARSLDLEKLLESWQKRHTQIHKDFDTIEDLLAVEEVLIKTVDHSSYAANTLSKLYLSLAARSRKANRVAVAYSALMKLESLEDQNQLSVFDRLQWKMQRAKLLWSQREGRSAIWTAKQVDTEIGGYLNQPLTPIERTDLLLLHVGVLTVTGKWVAAQRSESSQVIIDEYFKRATSIVEGIKPEDIGARIGRAAKAHVALAEYMGEMYHQVNARVTSREWMAGKKVAEARTRELAACKAMPREHQDANRQHILGLEREVAYDKEERASVENSVEQFLTGALANYGRGLALSSKAELATVFKMLSLWFGNHTNAAVNTAMKTLIDEVPSYKFVPLSYQIISRIGSGGSAVSTGGNAPGVYQDALSELVLKLCQQHPHHALIQLIALKNGGDVTGKNARAFRTNVGDAKSIKATEYLDVLRKTELGELVEAQDALSNLYIQLALFDTAEYQTKGIKTIRLVDVPVVPTAGSRMSSRDRLPNFDQCFRDLSRRSGNRGFIPAVITLSIAPRADLDYSRVVRVHSFAQTFSITDSGIHRPKILYCCGSNGVRFKQLVKGEDDTRQDLVIEQVFDAVNQFLKENEQTRQRNLRLVTYRVVPLSPAAGVLEWVDKTLPFGEYLTSRPSKRSGAHERYHPKEWRHSMCRQHLKNATTAATKLRAYSEIEANFTPVFHHFFLEKFPDPATWYSRRLAYVRSVAVTSIVGYILGIGDRHAHNILIHEETAEFVHIDFGVVFDQGMALFTPETVPFRLTRDMVDGMGVSGCDGVFSRCCEATLQLLRAKSASVVTILEVFVHDPLYRWMLSPLKALRIQKDDAAAATGANEAATATASGADEEEDDTSNDAAARALLRVKQKLEGFEDPNGNALSIEGQVKHLISEARNPRNLCRLFPGWAPWL